MKYYLTAIVFFFIFSSALHAQIKAIDSINISYKAKLLTTSRLGLADTLTIKKSFLSQKVEFITNPTKSIILLKIKFKQKYYLNNKNLSNYFYGRCTNYLGFNTVTNKFYRLGGCDTLDIKDFFDDLELIPSKGKTEFIYGWDNIYGDFDIFCLTEYNDLSERKKRKKGFKCFENCSMILNLKGKNLPHPID